MRAFQEGYIEKSIKYSPKDMISACGEAHQGGLDLIICGLISLIADLTHKGYDKKTLDKFEEFVEGYKCVKKNISQKEKESDREWADKVLAIVIVYVEELIFKHKECKEYHDVDGFKFSCLDVVLSNLRDTLRKSSEVSGNSSHN